MHGIPEQGMGGRLGAGGQKGMRGGREKRKQVVGPQRQKKEEEIEKRKGEEKKVGHVP